MKKSFKSQRGSYTIEASISLLLFVLAIMLIYSQIKVLICECIMQNAVNNMARETASYVYVLDRMGLVVQHADDEFENADKVTAEVDKIFADGGELSDNFGELLGGLFNDSADGGSGDIQTQVGEIKGNAQSMADSIKNIMSIFKGTGKEQWIAEAKNAGVYTVESVIKLAANSILSEFYNWKLDAYLPMERSEFCKYFMVDNDFKFSASRAFPNKDNNSILVVVEYDTTSPYSFFQIKRHVVKYAYVGAWVKSNAHQIGKEE